MRNGIEVDDEGNKFHYVDDKLHRVDGPAIEYSDGGKEWFQFGKRHREDGPAMDFGNHRLFWYLYGEECTKKEYDVLLVSLKLYIKYANKTNDRLKS